MHDGHTHPHDHSHEHAHTHSHEHTHSHNHSHDDGEHAHEHTHTHGGDETLALLKYMLNHNRQHTAELNDMAANLEKAGNTEASALLLHAVTLFEKGNGALEETVAAVEKSR